MKRIISLLFVFIILINSTSAQIKEGSDNIYFYREINNTNCIGCYFSRNKMYYETFAWVTFLEEPYSYFKRALKEKNPRYVTTAYFQPEKSTNTEKVYTCYSRLGLEFTLTFKDNMKTLIMKTGSTWYYKKVEKEDDTLNNDVIYE